MRLQSLRRIGSPRTLALSALLAFAGTASAQTSFDAPMDGLQENPPVVTPGTGAVQITLNTATGAFNLTGTYSNLSAPATAAHLHGPAMVGQNGGIVVPVATTGGTSGTFSGSGTLSAVNMDHLQSGLLYMNVHTATNPGGEIRGQVVAIPTVTTYGSGVNPAGSLSLVAGTPAIGTTFTLGVDNPLGTQAAGGPAFLLFSIAPDPLFACCGTGTLLPGLGMDGPNGELLIDLLQLVPPTLFGGPWAGPGSPAPIDVSLPNNKSLVGLTIRAQGILNDPSGTGPTNTLTEGATIYIGI